MILGDGHMVQLAFLFGLIGIPLIEIALFVVIGSRIGLVATILVVITTGIAGTILLRLEGIRVLGQVQRELNENRIPAAGLVGAMLLGVAGMLLIAPGFLTDVLGLLLFLPPVREMVARALIKAFRDRIVVVGPDAQPHHPGHRTGPGSGPVGADHDGRFADGPVIDEVAIEIDDVANEQGPDGKHGARENGRRSSPWQAGS